MRVLVKGLGFRAFGLGFRVCKGFGLGIRVCKGFGLGFRVCEGFGLGFRVKTYTLALQVTDNTSEAPGRAMSHRSELLNPRSRTGDYRQALAASE